MAEISVVNRGKNTRYIGGKAIPAGESRMVEESLVPSTMRPGTSAPEPEKPKANPVLAILDKKIPEIVAALPELSDQALDDLYEAEENGKTRKGVMQGIAEERLARSSRAKEVEEFVALLKEMDLEELQAELEADHDEGQRALIEKEIAERQVTGEGDGEPTAD